MFGLNDLLRNIFKGIIDFFGAIFYDIFTMISKFWKVVLAIFLTVKFFVKLLSTLFEKLFYMFDSSTNTCADLANKIVYPEQMTKYFEFINYFFPVDYFIDSIFVIFALWMAAYVFRLIKSFIPGLA